MNFCNMGIVITFAQRPETQKSDFGLRHGAEWYRQERT